MSLNKDCVGEHLGTSPYMRRSLMLLNHKGGKQKHPDGSSRGLQVGEGRVILLFFVGSCIFHVSVKHTVIKKRSIYFLQILLLGINYTLSPILTFYSSKTWTSTCQVSCPLVVTVTPKVGAPTYRRMQSQQEPVLLPTPLPLWMVHQEDPCVNHCRTSRQEVTGDVGLEKTVRYEDNQPLGGTEGQRVPTARGGTGV